jgi:lipopolysaccharide transport system permease protein
VQTVITPGSKWPRWELRELWQQRELVAILAQRDIRLRYRQTVLGVAWAVLQPLLTALVIALLFGRWAGLSQHSTLPYALVTFAALLPWQLFASAVSNASTSVVGSQAFVTKVYFPRLAIPLAAVGSSLVDFAVSSVMLVAMMLVYAVAPGATIVGLPLFGALALLCALAVGLWLAALNVAYRDVRYVIPFMLQLWLFATPIAYPVSIVPAEWRVLYDLNPMAVVVEGFRWALFGDTAPTLRATLVCTLESFALLVGGVAYFKRMETRLADII